MFDVEKIIKADRKVILIGSYPAIIQSILDFEYMSGHKAPSIVGVVATGRKIERYFFGKKEIAIPVFKSFKDVPDKVKHEVTFFLNVVSGRRVFSSTVEAIDNLPKLIGGVIFAENTPEKHALDLAEICETKGIFLAGPASVGILIPGIFKLGAIGGVEYKQLVDAKLSIRGNVAVFSASGGTTNELINILAQNGKKISFALHFGGDRFPITTPLEAFMAAENDPDTTHLVYFGELGGVDEYAVCEAIQTGKLTKPIIAYIAGNVAEIFPESPQFGHAKAMAKTQKETARAKRDAMKAAGVQVGESFKEFVELMHRIPSRETREDRGAIIEKMDDRRHALISTSVSKDEGGKATVLGEDLLSFSKNNSFGYIVASLFLGKKIKSKELEEFVSFVLKLLVDHGPYVSGAVNTIITSRAGRDLVSSLASGILTIGPRFGGAINQAAANWLDGASSGKTPQEFVEEYAKKKIYISGIGHRKYRSDMPDPRVSEIVSYTKELDAKYTNFAKSVEKVTVSKKGNLILNVDGAIACVMLDILSEKEGYSEEQLKELVDIEFFNALFVLSRSVGFISHFLDQKRLDEGLFRLGEEDVADASSQNE
ncbi:MAG TPA: citrate/2-methylcitrate synthase [Patescibacteria group bacterium]|nr:citrate/2-methylcitrate synthase [Patescibacteria group bacterium]